MQPAGCFTITNEDECVHSRDGRDWLRGERCLWCPNGPCISNSTNRCEPEGWLLSGEGKWYGTFLGKNDYRASTCQKRAYVMMAYDPPGSPPSESFWGALAMARALQRFSTYDVVLFTDTTQLPDGTDLHPGFSRLNVQVLPVEPIGIPGGGSWAFQRWNIAFWKLQAFKLTYYDKIMWLDTDAIAYRSLDWIFEKDGMWAQRDDWFCNLNQPDVCSGILSLVPRREDFDGMLAYAAQVGTERLVGGDQQLLRDYFRDVVQRPINLLDDGDAMFGQCVNRQPGGVWYTPAFVHKSGGWGNTNANEYSNVCFSLNVNRHRYVVVDGSVLNICHFHPLASHWRRMFCEAASMIGATLPEVASFCSESCYYHGKHPDGSPCEQNQAWELSGPLNATWGPGVLPGMPALQAAQASRLYLGCFVNDGTDRVYGHHEGLTLDACEAEARVTVRSFFGMEYPEGSAGPGQAGCLTLMEMPHMQQAADGECEGEGLFQGNRLGSSYRLAVYWLPPPRPPP